MNTQTYNQRIEGQTRPLVVEFWAAWCAPCKAMAVPLMSAAGKYQDKVDLLRIDVDKNPEISTSLNIMAIPTILGYSGGNLVFRRTGYQSAANIDKIFNDLVEGKVEQRSSVPLFSRIVRLVGGTALVLLGIKYTFSIPLIVAGGLVAFSAIYDRCPMYRAVSNWFKSTFLKKPLSKS
jgi:thioredoxin 1